MTELISHCLKIRIQPLIQSLIKLLIYHSLDTVESCLVGSLQAVHAIGKSRDDAVFHVDQCFGL